MPEVHTKHPTPQQLTEYGLGKLASAARTAIHEHLLACTECSRKVENQPPDSFIGQLKAGTLQGGTMLPAIPSPVPVASNTLLPGRKMPVTNKTLDGVPAELAASTKYDIVGKLGQGGMGAVYKAKHKFLGDHVAIKVMNANVVGNPDARSRFLREMQSAGQLKHPNIVRALDAEQIGDLLVLVMELVPGITLDQLVAQRGPLPVGFSCNCIMQAALGLQHAHEKKMIHRDIKPANLIITAKEKQVKLLDFGLARGPREQGQNNQTQMQTFMGTPEYVAPEQATDARSADIRSDIYSLGCTLYFLLAGRPPFRGETVMETIVRQIQDEPQPLPEVRPEVPAALWAVIARMMAKAPAQRYQTPIEVAETLKPFASDGTPSFLPPLAAAPAPSGEATSRMPPPIPPQGAEVSPFAPRRSSPPPARRRREQAEAKRKWPTWVVYVAVAAGLVTMSLFALLVLTFRTTKSKVVVEIDQKDAQVFVDGKDITIQVPGEMQPIEIQVDEGAHQLKVKKDGFEAVTRDFTYRKGKRDIIQVRMKLLPPTRKFPLGVGDPERVPILPKPEDVANNAPPIKPVVPKRVRKEEEEEEEVITNSIGMKLVRIPAGTFSMGSPKDEIDRGMDEGPEHDVRITKAFHLGVNLVTQGEYEEVMGNNPSSFAATGDNKHLVKDMNTTHFPVERVTYKDALDFCKKLSSMEKERKSGRLYRLPTEAEWEYACRGGARSKTPFGYGKSLSANQDNFNGNAPYPYGGPITTWLRRTCKVGSYKPNGFGLYDMHGNVYQWCSDWYGEKYYDESPKADPQGPSEGSRRVIGGMPSPIRRVDAKRPSEGSRRVVRGGSWFSAALGCRSAGRSGSMGRGNSLGFRVALVPLK